MEIHEQKLAPVHGYEEGRADAIDPDSSGKALTYKKDFLKRFIPLDGRQIERRLDGDRFYVTRKYDGEYAFIVHDGRQTVTVNRSGRVRRGIPCIEEAGRLLGEAGVGEAMLGAEIYAEVPGRRGRTGDLLAALANERRIGTLRLAVFDIVQWEGRPWRANYLRTWEKLREVFGNGRRVREVEMKPVHSAAEVRDIYEAWVVDGKAEGLVVRTDLPFVYKIKPRHNVDAAIIGFSEGIGAEKGQVRSLLLALMPRPGRYMVAGRVGSGMVEEVRELLFDRLSQRVIPSEYIETDANFVAFRMVRPDTVVEITVGDMQYETETGPKTNTLLEIVNGTFRIAGTVEGVKFVAPVFVRIRTDKKADAGDVRLAQIEHFAPSGAASRTASAPTEPPAAVAAAPAELLPSELLRREVYTKTIGDKLLVQKYMVWKTNKEQTGDYPAYVLYVANFSSQRQEPLQRDVDVTDDPGQVWVLLDRARRKNLKSGWRIAAAQPAAPSAGSASSSTAVPSAASATVSAAASSAAPSAASAAAMPAEVRQERRKEAPAAEEARGKSSGISSAASRRAPRRRKAGG